jgi:hypothetical protein
LAPAVLLNYCDTVAIDAGILAFRIDRIHLHTARKLSI